MNNEQRVIDVIKALLTRHKRPVDHVRIESPLYRGGLGLDSLGAAELSTMLEMTLGRDPYSEGQVPQTVNDIVQFYETAAGGQ
ncbi:MAG: acyl carrier protein [Gemmatimonadaceae bacterium]|nr:acyl carrier protein [Gemmatimonadaceae bacterium]